LKPNKSKEKATPTRIMQSIPSFQTPLRPHHRAVPMAPRRPSRPSPVMDEQKSSAAARALFREVHGDEHATQIIDEVTSSVEQMKESYFYSICRSLLFLSYDETEWVLYADFVRESKDYPEASMEQQIVQWLAEQTQYPDRILSIRSTGVDELLRLHNLIERTRKISLFMRIGQSLFSKTIKLSHAYRLYENWCSTLPKNISLNRYQRMVIFMNKYKSIF
jgi:hypothetical protein